MNVIRYNFIHDVICWTQDEGESIVLGDEGYDVEGQCVNLDADAPRSEWDRMIAEAKNQ